MKTDVVDAVEVYARSVSRNFDSHAKRLDNFEPALFAINFGNSTVRSKAKWAVLGDGA